MCALGTNNEGLSQVALSFLCTRLLENVMKKRDARSRGHCVASLKDMRLQFTADVTIVGDIISLMLSVKQQATGGIADAVQWQKRTGTVC